MISRTLRDPQRRTYVIECVGRIVKHELSKFCSDSYRSILRSEGHSVLKDGFSWELVISEARETMPTLLRIMTRMTETPKKRTNTVAVIGMIIAILAKHRRPQASLVQKVISLLLYSGHSSKSVCIDCMAINELEL